MANTNIIEIKDVSKVYDGKTVVKNETISIKHGEFVTLLGPSGCGKTTTLRMIAGFEMPDSGKILFDGKDITTLPPHERKVNTVFQKYALFPHLNVFNNIAFGLKLKMIPDGTTYTTKKGKVYENLRKLTKEEIETKVNKALKMVDLEDYGHRYVDSLSGGQQQRVAIARAIVNEPKVLLLDEPLGALDLKMRQDMQIELMDMHKNLGITFIYVTHDQEEALTMSDTIVVMRDGEVQQIGTPQKIYDEPANAFVADFIGESNIFSGTMIDDYKCSFIGYEFECVDKGFKPNEQVDIIVRPEDIYITKGKAVEKAMFSAVVATSIFKGDHYEIVVDVNGNELRIFENSQCLVGEEIGIYINPIEIHIMHKARITNEYETVMGEAGKVLICEKEFQTNSSFAPETKVKVTIPFDKVEVSDDESDGIVGAEVVMSIYKGSYYQVILRTDYDYDFFVDTNDDWLKGDRVGISVKPEYITVEAL
ncbi:MAG: ABC transporter ATP-binding protein [Clostridia bacterium]